jgi:predicted aminopeptidase
MTPRKKSIFRLLLIFLPVCVALLLSVASCSNLHYYTQSTRGHLQIMAERQPIVELLNDPACSPELKAKLATVLDIRDFASRELLLPENGSYRSYVDLKRPHVVWNVVAAPEFSLEPMTWCFPVAGCVSYRGFYTKEEADKFAENLSRRGLDVYSYGVSAYSTLGWFDDPVLNTFLNRSEADLAGLIFHELAHQKLYIKNDTSFNEAFAKTVEAEGVLRWLSSKGDEAGMKNYLRGKKRDEEFIDLGLRFQEDLALLYGQPMTDAEKRAGKKRILQEMRDTYTVWKKSWGGFSGYDRWFEDLNNAKFVSLNAYHAFVPAFRAILDSHDGDLASFYEEAGEVGHLPVNQRVARMEELRSIMLARQVLPDGEAPVGDEDKGVEARL